MAYETLKFEKKDGMAVMTMNRPENLNSVNTRMQAEMTDIWNDIEADKSVRVVIITGGPKCFCSGADIKEQFPPGKARPSSRDFFKRIEDSPLPSIAAISGYCLGGGLELALCCDLRIATNTSKFGLVEIRIGAVPGAGGMQRLPRIIGITKAKEMLYTAMQINAEEAYRLTLINKIVTEETLQEEAEKLAATLLTFPPHGLKVAKRCVNEGMQVDLNTALKLDVAIAAAEMALPLSQANRLEGQTAFREKRKPNYKAE